MSGKGYSINYSESLDQPSIDQMQPIVRVYSQLYKTTGNPNLEAGRSHNFSFNYYNYNYDKQLNTNFNTGITLTNNTVIAITTIDSVGARTATYVNRNNAISAYFSGNIGKQFKKSQKSLVSIKK
jgi:outer membrane receptor protein involved in Fe transport